MLGRPTIDTDPPPGQQASGTATAVALASFMGVAAVAWMATDEVLGGSAEAPTAEVTTFTRETGIGACARVSRPRSWIGIPSPMC